jgi:malonate transporter and related proteins
MVPRRLAGLTATLAGMDFAGPVLQVVLPVYGLIAVGWLALRAGAIAEDEVRRFTDFTFVVFVPAQLFRAMARTDFATLPLGVPLAYFCAALLVFGTVVALRWRYVSPLRAAVEGLGASFSNTVMIGIPLVSLGWGESGMVMLLSIIAFHSLVLLSIATFVFELASASGALGPALARAVKASLIHPVVLPILLGAGWSATGVPLPPALDATLGFLAAASSPLCLVLLGASLGRDGPLAVLRPAAGMTALKLIAMPLVALGIGHLVFDLSPLALTVIVLTAALPIGANVFLFAQRYQADTTAAAGAVVWSTLFAAPLLAVLLPLLPVPPR